MPEKSTVWDIDVFSIPGAMFGSSILFDLDVDGINVRFCVNEYIQELDSGAVTQPIGMRLHRALGHCRPAMKCGQRVEVANDIFTGTLLQTDDTGTVESVGRYKIQERHWDGETATQTDNSLFQLAQQHNPDLIHLMCGFSAKMLCGERSVVGTRFTLDRPNTTCKACIMADYAKRKRQRNPLLMPPKEMDFVTKGEQEPDEPTVVW